MKDKKDKKPKQMVEKKGVANKVMRMIDSTGRLVNVDSPDIAIAYNARREQDGSWTVLTDE